MFFGKNRSLRRKKTGRIRPGIRQLQFSAAVPICFG